MLLGSLGWGQIIIRYVGGADVVLPFSVQIVVGLAVYAWVIGTLNLFSSAGGVTSSLILTLGLVFFVARLFNPSRRQALLTQLQSVNVWTAALILLISFFMLSTTVPTELFNFHDDFRTYFITPLRMAETGSMIGPRDFLQASAISGQGLLQSLVWFWLGAGYLNLIELFIFLMLVLFVLDSIGQLFEAPVIVRLLSVTLLAAINPQYVNVSAIYSTSAAFLTAAYLMLITQGAHIGMQKCQAKRWRLIVLTAPVFVFMVVTKATALPFALLLLALYPFLSGERFWLRGVPEVLFLSLTALIFWSPWLVMLEGAYDEILQKAWNSLSGFLVSAANASAAPAWEIEASRNSLKVFAFGELFWGGSTQAYNALVLLVWVGVGAASFPANASSTDGTLLRDARRSIWWMASVVTLGYLSGLVLYKTRPDLVVRYAIPVLLAASPAVILMSAGIIQKTIFAHQRTRWWLALVGILSTVGTIYLFGPAWLERMHRQINYHTLLAFPSAYTSQYKRYLSFSLSDAPQELFARAQSATEPGTSILAWVSTPFHFDFNRNAIAVMDDPGTINLFFMINGAPAEKLHSELCAKGFNYVAIQYNDFGMRYNRPEDNYVRDAFVGLMNGKGKAVFHSEKESLLVYEVLGCGN